MFPVSILSVMAADQRFAVCGQCLALLMRKNCPPLKWLHIGLVFLRESVTNETEVSSSSPKWTARCFVCVCGSSVCISLCHRPVFFTISNQLWQKCFIRLWSDYHEHNFLSRLLFIYCEPLGSCFAESSNNNQRYSLWSVKVNESDECY